MADSKENNNQTWQNLEWAKKVQICQQGIANEDSLLLTLAVLFIASEAILFTVLLGRGWGQLWSISLFIKNSTEYPSACWRDESGSP